MVDQENNISRSLESRVSTVEVSVKNLVNQFVSFENHVRTTLQDIVKQQKTSWPTIISFVSLLIVIGGLAFAPILYRLSALEASIVVISDRERNVESNQAAQGQRVRALEREVFNE